MTGRRGLAECGWDLCWWGREAGQGARPDGPSAGPMGLVLDLVLGLMLVRRPGARLMDVVLVDVVRTGLMLGRGCGGRPGQFGSEVADWQRARWKTQRGIDNPAILR